jgi:hypothetical protein
MGVLVVLLAARPALGGFASGGERDGAVRRLVTVVRAPDADAASREITTRIIAELMADGVPVMALTCAPEDAACAALSDGRTLGTVVVQGHGVSRTVEVRVESGPDANRVHRLAAEASGRGPAALAVRTVELLRAMSLDGDETSTAERPMRPMRPMPTPSTSLSSPPPPPLLPWPSRSSSPSPTGGIRRASLGEPATAPPPPPLAAPVRAGTTGATDATATQVRVAPTSVLAAPVAPTAARPAHSLNLTATVGAAMIGSFSGLNNGFGPTARVGRQISDDRFMLSLFLLGPAFGKDQQNAAGNIVVMQGLVAIDLDVHAPTGKRVMFRAGVGSGFYVIRVSGQPALAFMGGDTIAIGRSDSAVSIAISGSAGLVAKLHPDVGVFVDARLFVISPTPVVLLGGSEVGRAGNPGIVLASGIEVRL